MRIHQTPKIVNNIIQHLLSRTLISILKHCQTIKNHGTNDYI